MRAAPAPPAAPRWPPPRGCGRCAWPRTSRRRRAPSAARNPGGRHGRPRRCWRSVPVPVHWPGPPATVRSAGAGFRQSLRPAIRWPRPAPPRILRRHSGTDNRCRG
ncbi:hypothetical protein G6F35_013546 [Rhizopus arrhizus]|nr:hypothetical protein G6F35_013546 [Rhizopus arrhizus]